MIKRVMRINKIDGTYIDLNISKATSVDTKTPMINLDQLKDGTWRLIWDKSLISKFDEFKNIEMIREN